MDRPVLVVGAGPTGLTAAMELSRLGVPVRIVDKAPEAARTSRATDIHARTLELLVPRGVGHHLLQSGIKVTGTTLYGRGRRLITLRLDKMASRYNQVLLLDQAKTEQLLRDQVKRQGVHVEHGVELLSFTQGPEGVRAVLKSDRGEEVLDAAYLIGAEGAHSGVRHALGLSFEGRSLPDEYALADVLADGPLRRDEQALFVSPKGFVAIFPISGEWFRIMATDEGGDEGTPDLARMQELCDQTLPFPCELRGMNWSSRFRVHSRHASALRAGSVLLGGDAAHVHSPAAGQGMNAGIQDMVNLCWKLAMVYRGQAKPELLDTYQSDRLPVVVKMVRGTERLATAVPAGKRRTHQLVTRVLPLVLSPNIMHRKVSDWVGQVTVTYRGTAITHGAGRAGPLRAGDRVPDVAVHTGGNQTRLHDLLDTDRLTLLTTGPQPELAPWRHLFTDHVLAPQPGLLTKGTAMLVRPDGYLGAAGSTATLASWLDKWFERSSQ
ncbi:2-polyprenyl-6-methoxyphenol hydroxylase-like FAD-dependent oxidoreductase [Kibdelosporangium phytohabitans]|uniref:FAD-binding domain-containing protein n=2 Tax=Kibdelosporangium phytohabitans TaxID=860235 RepID=A0A0N9I645_9PSEU|nr:hypothetical protein AOZ06_28730 [Kibdelosporangium phytohabitans]MBE1461395.1 2-polyprenyl-6-methoxyphenol hydroxylase-like FAD-dependent oxidoreductase [Kibdelosporangium phytohabitans]